MSSGGGGGWCSVEYIAETLLLSSQSLSTSASCGRRQIRDGGGDGGEDNRISRFVEMLRSGRLPLIRGALVVQRLTNVAIAERAQLDALFAACNEFVDNATCN